MGKGRAPCCDKSKVKRGPWSTEEDFRLITFIHNNGHPWNWRALPTQAGLLRCGKSCRLRWINYLRPDLKRGNFTEEEEDTIIKLHQSLGNRWSKIASYLPGRTDNEIKNVWNTHLKKRLANYCDNESKRISRTSSFNSSSTTSFSISSNLSNGHLNSISAQTDGSIPIEEEEEEEDDDSFNLGAYEANNKSVDFWDILEPNFQFHDHDIESSQSSKFGEENGENGEIFNWQQWLRDLENELGLEPTRDFGSG